MQNNINESDEAETAEVEVERLPTEGDGGAAAAATVAEEPVVAAANGEDDRDMTAAADEETESLPNEEDGGTTAAATAAAVDEDPVVAAADGEEDVTKIEDATDVADDAEKGNDDVATADRGNQATQNDDNTNRPVSRSQPGVLFVPGPDFRGGIHTGYHSAHESDEDNNDGGNGNVDYDVADTLLVEGTLVPDEGEIPTYEATLVTEESPEVTSKWCKTPLLVCGGFTVVGAALALAIGLPLGLRTTPTPSPTGENNSVTALSSPSVSPTVSSRPSLRSSSFPSLSPTTTPFFKKKGQPKNGNAPMDLFGGTFSLSNDGNTVAVSAPQLGPMPNRSGYVLILKWNETLSDFEELGEPMFGDNYGDGFGYSLALSGDASKLAIGTPYHDTNGEQSGYVKIYLWNENALNYTHTGDIFYGTKDGDLFGDTLQMSSDGKTLAIGGSSSDTNGADAGEVRIYRWNDTDFKLNEVLYGEEGDRFGYSLAISPDGNVIAAGAIGTQNARYVKTYAWDADDMIYKQRGLPIYDDPSLKFGWSCSLSDGGMYLATGALHVTSGGSFDDSAITTPGQVKVFQWNGTVYTQVGDTLLGDGNVDEFGGSIDISRDGKILVVAAPMNDSNNGVQSGQVKLFNLNDSGSNYTLYGEPLVGEASSNYFGGPVALSGDAKSFAVGAVGNTKQGDFSGQLQIFHIPSSL